MSTSGKPTIEELITLCNFDGENYVQKSGDEYVSALSRLFSLDNRNDKPFTVEDIRNQPLLSEFAFAGKNDFKKVCTLSISPLVIQASTRKRTNEKIVAKDFVSAEAKRVYESSLGVAYLMTCKIDGDERIIKIGQTRKTFKERLGSYNCGCVYNWRTASTTNLKLKQSMVATRQDIQLYLYDCQQTEIFVYHGIKSAPFATAYSLAVEDIMIKQFMHQFGKKPLVNIQANAGDNE